MEQLELFHIPYGSEMTVQEAFELLWRSHLSYKPSGSTFMANRKALCRSIGHKAIHLVNEIDIIQHKESRLRAGFKLGTVYHDHTLVTLLFNKFYAWKRKGIVIDQIDFSKIKLPREHPTIGIGKKKPQPRKTIITPNEFSRLIEHSTDRLRDIIYFAIYTGIRKGDLVRLKIGNFNTTTNQIEIIQNKTGKPLSLPTNDRLKRIILAAIKSGHKHILDTVNFDGEWRVAKRKAKLGHIEFRDLRRSASSEAYRYCKDPRKVRDLLGHASDRTTMETYVITESQNLKPVVRHLEKVFR